MQIGMVGLGRMGMNMAKRLIQHGHKVTAYNRSPDKTKKLAAFGGRPAFSLSELVQSLESPKAIWIMLPNKVVADYINEFKSLLSPNDLIIDGGNSHYKEDFTKAEILKEKSIQYLDVGVSGGIWGLENGFCLMIGGPKKAYEFLEPIFKDLAPSNGYLYCGPQGSGHFTKMIHNGIEYGMMQAYAEGFELLEQSPYGKDLDLRALANLWNQGSVIRSWLLKLLEQALAKDPKLEKIQGYVEDSGEGRWTIEQAIEQATSAPCLTLALMQRFRSRQENTFNDRVLAALRQEFGGHATKKA